MLYLHDESLAQFGGSAGIREPGLVESALGSAQNAFWYGHGNLFDVAAAYAFHLAEAQAFIDGNKRTAAAAAIAFLRVNGIQFPKDDGSVYAAMIGNRKEAIGQAGTGCGIAPVGRTKELISMVVAELNPQSAIRNPRSDEVVVSVRGLTKVFKDFWGWPKAHAMHNERRLASPQLRANLAA